LPPPRRGDKSAYSTINSPYCRPPSPALTGNGPIYRGT
jgi:hypothetical protein